MQPVASQIVLVHGLWDNPRLFDPLVKQLNRDDVEIFTPNLPHQAGRMSLMELAIELDRKIHSRFDALTPIVLLGFSMGGLISRLWLQEIDGAVRTKHFISVGSPHRGTLTAQPVPRWLFKGIAEMKRGSDLISALNKKSYLLDSVKCSSYFCRWDLMVFPGWQAVLPIGAFHAVPVISHKALMTETKSVEILASAILTN